MEKLKYVRIMTKLNDESIFKLITGLYSENIFQAYIWNILRGV